MWHLPGPGIEPMFPTLAGGFLTTTPPGKSSALNSFLLHFFCCDSSPYIVSLYGAHWLYIFLSFSFGSLIWMLSTNLPSTTLILFFFFFPLVKSVVESLCWILQFTHCIVHVKLLQSCLTVCDPMDCSHQAPLSTGFSSKHTEVGCHALPQGIFRTQGSNPSLTFPALADRFFTTSATWEAHSFIIQLQNSWLKNWRSESHSVMFDSLWPHGYTVHGILQALLEWVVFPFSRGCSQPKDQTQVLSIADWFFTSWATREDQENTGVGSLSLLQQIFLTQELNWGLLHYRWILYQLSYEGSPLRSKPCHTWITCMPSHFSHIWLFVTPWTIAHQAPLSMGFSRHEYWSGLPCPPLGDLSDPGILCLLYWQLGSLPLASSWKPQNGPYSLLHQ